MKAIKPLTALAFFLTLFASAGAQAQALAAGAKVTDAASCQNIPNKKNIPRCQKCVAEHGVWTTGGAGCSNKPHVAAKPAPKPVVPHTAKGTKVTDAAACQHITNKGNINACKTCVGGGKVWTTGTGSPATACSAK